MWSIKSRPVEKVFNIDVKNPSKINVHFSQMVWRRKESKGLI